MYMPGSPLPFGASTPSDPVQHELPPLRYEGEPIPLRLEVRRGEDGTWRGRLLFGARSEEAPATAEIFCATTEADLWECVRDLREHHLRDLYRSVVE